VVSEQGTCRCPAKENKGEDTGKMRRKKGKTIKEIEIEQGYTCWRRFGEESQ